MRIYCTTTGIEIPYSFPRKQRKILIFRAEVNDDGAYIQYLDATLDIENGEFYEDDFEEETYLVLHMTYRNNSSTYRSEGDEDTVMAEVTYTP